MTEKLRIVFYVEDEEKNLIVEKSYIEITVGDGAFNLEALARDPAVILDAPNKSRERFEIDVGKIFRELVGGRIAGFVFSRLRMWALDQVGNLITLPRRTS